MKDFVEHLRRTHLALTSVSAGLILAASVAPSYTLDRVGEQLGLKASDVRNHLFAVRERLRTEIRGELRETVSNPDQLESEWKALFC